MRLDAILAAHPVCCNACCTSSRLRVQLLRTCHPPDPVPRLARIGAGATAGTLPSATERRKPRPGEGQGVPVNAAAVLLRQQHGPLCDRLTDRRQTPLGKRNTRFTSSWAKLSQSSLPHSLRQSLQRDKDRGDKSPGVLLVGYSASAARQAVGEAAVVKVAPTRVHEVNARRCPYVPRRAGLSTASTSRAVVHRPGCPCLPPALGQDRY